MKFCFGNHALNIFFRANKGQYVQIEANNAKILIIHRLSSLTAILNQIFGNNIIYNSLKISPMVHTVHSRVSRPNPHSLYILEKYTSEFKCLMRSRLKLHRCIHGCVYKNSAYDFLKSIFFIGTSIGFIVINFFNHFPLKIP